MTPEQCNADILTPALAMLPARMDSPAARRMLLAIGLQESALKWRRQMPNGPARGLWQFEEGGGVHGVLRHPASSDQAQLVCLARHVKPEARPVWLALEDDDILDACFARLLLWTDPRPLPDDADDAWAYYLRNWRPGKPHPDRWPDNWARASEAVPA